MTRMLAGLRLSIVTLALGASAAACSQEMEHGGIDSGPQDAAAAGDASGSLDGSPGDAMLPCPDAGLPDAAEPSPDASLIDAGPFDGPDAGPPDPCDPRGTPDAAV